MSPIINSRCFSVCNFLCAAVVLIYCCQPTPAVLTEDDAVSSLVSGLRANQVLLKLLLPQPLQPSEADPRSDKFEQEMRKFYGLLHSLARIGERARETRALTLSSRQDDAELMAVEVVLRKLTENACSLLQLKVGNQTGCSYSELMTLKTKLDVLNTVMDEDPISAYRGGRLGSINIFGWLNSTVVCNLPASALRALNSHTNLFNQDHC